MTFICECNPYAGKVRIWYTRCAKMNVLSQGLRKLSSDRSYAWSLPVTWPRWRSHHSIRHIWNPTIHANLMSAPFIEPELWATEVYITGKISFLLFCFCDLDVDLDLMSFIYKLDPYSLEIHRMNFLRESFRKSSSDRHTDRATSYGLSFPVTWQRWRS